MILTIVVFMLVLSLLVFVHELGHFYSCVKLGVKPEEFGLGFPPRVVGFYRDNQGKWRRVVGSKEVTDAQLDRTYKLLEKIPESERPVLTNRKGYTWARDKNFEVSTVDRHYGVRLESMTKDEFIDFAKGALSGEIQPVEDHAETSYFFRMMPQMGFDPEQIEEMAIHTIQGRMERLKGKDRPEFADEYLLGYAVSTVYHSKTPNAERIVADTVSQLNAAGIKIPYDIESCHEKMLESKKAPMIDNDNV